ncbi:MAG TPA: ABC-type transport auxiliary lipoprotein family protein [Candidatus Kapabacteria bacterium]|nr:ABC-type transport auxiliary lipoprotein family protein [Candidatus Kapabacteria bacterium]
MKLTLIFFIISIFSLNSCINLKNEYPDIKYYSLSQIKDKSLDIYKVDASLYVRNISTNSIIYGSQLIINWDDASIQKYFYHRWAEDFDLIANDFITQRIQESGLFKQGVTKVIGSILPDYILDISIDDLDIDSKSNSDEINSVTLQITISLIKRNFEGKDNIFLFNKTYQNRAIRKNNKVENVAENTSLVLSKIVDDMIVDISNTIINTAGKK